MSILVSDAASYIESVESRLGVALGAAVGAWKPYSGGEDGIPHHHLVCGVREDVGQVGADQGGVSGLQADRSSIDDHIYSTAFQQDDFFAGVDDRQLSVYAAGRQFEPGHQGLGFEFPGGHGGHDLIAHIGVGLGQLDHLLLAKGQAAVGLVAQKQIGGNPQRAADLPQGGQGGVGEVALDLGDVPDGKASLFSCLTACLTVRAGLPRN